MKTGSCSTSGQAGGERVDLVLLVELHHLLVLALLVVLVLLLDLLDLRRELLQRPASSWNCLIVSGSISVADDDRQRDDRRRPSRSRPMSWKNRRTCSKTSMSGWKMFARTNGMKVS